MRRSRVFLAAAFALGCGGGGDSSTGPAAVALVSISPGNQTIVRGDSRTLVATDEDAQGNALTGRTFSWSTTDGAIVTVSPNGATATVTGVGAGSADVVATSEGKADTVTFTVTLPPASIALTAASTDTLRSRGDTVRLTAVVRDSAGATLGSAPVTFTSTSTSVATVNAQGLVSAVENGRDSIVGQAGTVKSFVIVNVRRVYSKLVLSPKPITVLLGGTATATATPQDARGAAITGLPAATFSSTDSTKAKVNSNGLVTAVAAGTAQIIAALTTSDGTHADTATVTVQSQTYPLTATVNMVGTSSFNPSTVNIAAGGTVTFTNATGITHNVTFTSTSPTPPAGTSDYSSGSKDITFPTAGTFSYECSIHPNMVGSVIVH